jgi:hypothetical protein
MFFVLKQEPVVYVIVAVPALIPVITPVAGITVALLVLLLVHTPPLMGFVKVVEDPTQTLVVPVILANVEFTVTCVIL